MTLVGEADGIVVAHIARCGDGSIQNGRVVEDNGITTDKYATVFDGSVLIFASNPRFAPWATNITSASPTQFIRHAAAGYDEDVEFVEFNSVTVRMNYQRSE